MRKKLGIVGGLGPAAGARLLVRVTDYTNVPCDQDHLDVTLLSRPQIPDRTAYLLGEPGAASFVEPIQEAVAQLEALGCEVLAIPCNTAHARLEAFCEVLSAARIVSMIDEVKAVMQEFGCARCGVLATTGTRKTRVYESVLEPYGIESVWPGEAGQAQVTDVIYNMVKAGAPLDAHALDTVFDEPIDKGCDSLVLACTELSVLGCAGYYRGIPVIDALDALARRCVIACGAPAYGLFDPSRLAMGC